MGVVSIVLIIPAIPFMVTMVVSYVVVFAWSLAWVISWPLRATLVSLSNRGILVIALILIVAVVAVVAIWIAIKLLRKHSRPKNRMPPDEEPGSGLSDGSVPLARRLFFHPALPFVMAASITGISLLGILLLKLILWWWDSNI